MTRSTINRRPCTGKREQRPIPASGADPTGWRSPPASRRGEGRTATSAPLSHRRSPPRLWPLRGRWIRDGRQDLECPPEAHRPLLRSPADRRPLSTHRQVELVHSALKAFNPDPSSESPSVRVTCRGPPGRGLLGLRGESPRPTPEETRSRTSTGDEGTAPPATVRPWSQRVAQARTIMAPYAPPGSRRSACRGSRWGRSSARPPPA